MWTWRRSGAQVCLINDVTAAGYFHRRHAAESFCITTVSSGVGNKVFVEGRPVVGVSGRGGEIGHIVVDGSPDAPLCDCGGRGHLGAVASGRGALAAIQRAAREDRARFQSTHLGAAVAGEGERIDCPHIVAAFRDGDPWVAAQIRRATVPLARVLAGIHNAIGIERFVIIGGFATALGDSYRRTLAELAAESSWNLGQDWDAWFELGDSNDAAGMIGAGLAAMQHWETAS